MFFNVPDDLTHLDIVNGQCYNQSIKQNVSFETQGPFGLGDENAAGSLAPPGFLGSLGTCIGLMLMLAAALL